MRELGTVEFFYRERFAVIRVADRKIAFKLGYTVYGPDLAPIGKAVDVLGPLKEPRVLVKLIKEGKLLKEGSRSYYDPRELKKVVRR